MPHATRLPTGLLEEASRTYGIVGREQVAAFLTRGQLRALVVRGDLVAVARGVYRLPGAPTSFRQRAAAATCAYGHDATVSHRSAGVLWLDDARPAPGAPIDVTLPRRRSGRRAGTAVHHADLGADERTVRHGIVVTTPLRTLVDLAPTTSAERLAATADTLVAAGALRPAELASGLARYSSGRRGHARLVLATAAHLAGTEAHADRLRSASEEQVRRWLLEAGLPAPVRQHPVVLEGRTVHLDLAYPAAMVAIEFDGWRWHAGREAFDRDRRRWGDLQLAGWVVVVVTAAQGPAEVVGRVRRALELQAARPR